MKIAVVTPHFKEARHVLERCLDSVRAQSVSVDHIIVADGHPQLWVEKYDNVRHVVLAKSTGDFGDTPRSLGFVMGIRLNYDIIQFLDADNILFGDHFEAVMQGFSSSGADLIVARRHMLRPDGSIMNYVSEEDDQLRHVDTSCYVFSRSAFAVGLKWSFIPQQFGCFDDRVFYAVVRCAGLKLFALPTKTVGYTCLWPEIYRAIGEVPPPGYRDIRHQQLNAKAWWNGLADEERRQIEKNLGVSINF
jgi:glycosyltransferase involved in cell wall biosynthesis